jgi:hypothetical protein
MNLNHVYATPDLYYVLKTLYSDLEPFFCFVQYLAAGVLPKKIPTSCMDLSNLSLNINFDNLKEISAALCLLRSSPNLRKLEIFVSTHLV